METLQSVLGIIGLIALFIVLVVLFYIWRFWLKIKKGLKDLGETAGATQGVPQILHLNESIDLSWLDSEECQTMIQILENAEFRMSLCYDVAEMPDTQMQFLVHEKGILAVLYNHPAVGFWVELTAQLKENHFLVMTNSDQQAFLRYPDWLDMHYLENEKVESLIQHFFAKLGNRKPLSLPTDSLRDLFEDNYKNLMQWRNASGGVSLDEVRYQNSKTGQNLDEEQVLQTYKHIKAGEFHSWTQTAIDELVRQNFPFDQEASYFIVPEQGDCESFFEYVADYFQWTEKQYQGLLKISKNRNDCFFLFKAMNERLSKELRARFVCEIDFPLPAKVYQASTVEIQEFNP